MMSRITIEKVWNGYILSGSSQKEVYSELAEVLVRIVNIYSSTIYSPRKRSSDRFPRIPGG